MHLNDYQKMAMEFSILKDEDKIMYGVMNTASEAGEIAGKYAKAIRDDHGLELSAMIKEMGDVLWSLACLAEGLDITLDEVAVTNLYKLQDRKERDVIGGSGDDR